MLLCERKTKYLKCHSQEIQHFTTHTHTHTHTHTQTVLMSMKQLKAFFNVSFTHRLLLWIIKVIFIFPIGGDKLCVPNCILPFVYLNTVHLNAVHLLCSALISTRVVLSQITRCRFALTRSDNGILFYRLFFFFFYYFFNANKQ